jgi:cyclopropane-fatty-acyl-phospholipid synthase
MNTATARTIDWTEQGLVPDVVVRHGIRRLLRGRLAGLQSGDCETVIRAKTAFIASMRDAPIAPLAHKANEQHYELPVAFFDSVLGRHRKYSCAYWPVGVSDLHAAEAAALQATSARACLMDDMDILELGCGWGSLTLWMAAHFPNSRITAVSNSVSQRALIEAESRRRGLSNVKVITSDMNTFSTARRFDRVVSVEMFEHMRNWPALFARVSDWLKPGGYFFMHTFCHREVPYPFEPRSDQDWMSRFFFSGGMMPSDDLPLHFQDHLRLVQQWRWNGMHYERTANAWLERMDAARDTIWPVLQDVYGQDHAQQWWMRWRMFFMACAELFGYQQGQQWWVSHYLFDKPVTAQVVR